MEIIQGQDAVVTQVRTTSVSTGGTVPAVCRGVRQPGYQPLRYHRVKDAAMSEPFLVSPAGAAVENNEAPVVPGKVHAEPPTVKQKRLGSMQRGMTLRELFGRGDHL